MKYDGLLDIAEGHSARSKKWQNKQVHWSELVDKLSGPVVTKETLQEYQAASKAARSKIKDVGGYVGAYLRNGRRKPTNVGHRQLVTLDIDFAHGEVWEDLTMQLDNAMALHSTHSHTEELPKYRLIMPLSRECGADEYEAVSRYLAGLVGIELFDETGFQPYRLMFWPSCSKDAKYYFKEQDGPWADVDEILSTYADWTDSSLWPTSKRHEDDVKRKAAKQQDPHEKKGLIGAFCRAYDIHEAIEAFLADDYTLFREGRYTYLKGSTAGGLVTYDNKYAYSHHGTDPSSGELCNAFDLVRLHLFGHLDDESRARGANLPSFKAMEELVRADKRVKRAIAQETQAGAAAAFDDLDPDELAQDEDDLDWTEELEVDRRGAYKSTAQNITLIIANDKGLKGNFRYNCFDSKRYVFASLPWRKLSSPEPIRNVDYSGLRNYLETVYGISASAKIEDALALEFETNSYHPVREYLEECEANWDGQDRAETLLIDYLGAHDSTYTRESILVWLTAAVARILRPGVKFDLVLTLVGEQGTGKSTFFRKLGRSWTSDSFVGVHGKEAYEQLQGSWLIEIAELSGFRKADVESIKHFISKQEDTFRPAYARSSETYLRQCVFAATTNKRDFLRDDTGNRRFLPIDISPDRAAKSVFRLSAEDVAQVWGEAVHRYRTEPKLYLTGESERLAKLEQSAHRETDERAGIVEKFLDTRLPKNWDNLDIFERRIYLDNHDKNGTVIRDCVCVAEVWCEALEQPKDKMTRYNTTEINKILRSLDDWEEVGSTKKFNIYGRQRYYQRKLS